MIDKHTFRAIYDEVTGSSRHDFLFLDLQADDKHKTFYKNLNERIVFPESEED